VYGGNWPNSVFHERDCSSGVAWWNAGSLTETDFAKLCCRVKTHTQTEINATKTNAPKIKKASLEAFVFDSHLLFAFDEFEIACSLA
jgi:hypothetical protein